MESEYAARPDNNVQSEKGNHENLQKGEKIVKYTQEALDKKVGWMEIVWKVFSIAMRLFTFIFNFYVAYNYFTTSHSKYGWWTLGCIFVPLIITTVLYYCLFLIDQKKESKRQNLSKLEIFIHIIILPMLLRNYKSLKYGWQSKRSKEESKRLAYYKKMMDEESDITMIRLFDCFLDAAPQKVLQISIILRTEHLDDVSWVTWGAVVFCFINMGLSMVAYNRYVRLSQADAKNLTMCAIIFQMLGYLCITISRILCISMIVCLSPLWTALTCSVHAIAYGLFLILYDKVKIFNNQINWTMDKAFCICYGFIYIFAFIMTEMGHTRIRYCIYYFICNLENIAVTIIFALCVPEYLKETVLYLPILIVTVPLYIVGIIIMAIYYLYFHPKSEYIHCIDVLYAFL